MSLINNGKNKDKKKGNPGQSGGKSAFFAPKSSTNTKAAQRSKKLTGGSQRGS
jgi:hypothetical protein